MIQGLDRFHFQPACEKPEVRGADEFARDADPASFIRILTPHLNLRPHLDAPGSFVDLACRGAN